MEPRESSWLRVDGRLRSWASRSGGGRSSRSTSSPTLRASASSTWRSSTTDAQRLDRTVCDAALPVAPALILVVGGPAPLLDECPNSGCEKKSLAELTTTLPAHGHREAYGGVSNG